MNERIPETKTTPGTARGNGDPAADLLQAVVGSIPLALDLTALLQRAASIFAEVAEHPYVEIYRWNAARIEFSPAMSTDDMPSYELPDGLPTDFEAGANHQIVRATVYDLTGIQDTSALIVPMVFQGKPTGLAVLVDPGYDLIDERIERLNQLATALAPLLHVSLVHDAVKHSAMADPDSDTYTFEYLQHRLRHECARASRSNNQVAIGLIQPLDFDDLERQYGYEAVDEVLRLLTRQLLAAVRDTDIVARWRGSGFAILLPDSDESGAALVMRRFSKQVNLEQDAVRRSAGFAAGVASSPTDGLDASSLMLAAEQRLLEHELQLQSGSRVA